MTSFLQNNPSHLSPVPMSCEVIKVKAQGSQVRKTLLGQRPALVLAYQPVFLLSLYFEFFRYFLLCQLGDIFKIKCHLIKIAIIKIVASVGKVAQGMEYIVLLEMKHLFQGWG